MSFTYTQNIPGANNNPSEDQSKMLTNTNSIYDLVAVDHVTFGNATGGQHNKVTFPILNPQGAPGAPASVMYTEAGAESQNAQLKFRNASGAYPTNIIKAYGVYRFTNATTTVAAVGSQNFNITSIGAASAPSVPRRTLNFDIDIAGAGIPALNNNIGVLVSISPDDTSRNINATYSFTTPTLTFNVINSATSQAPGNFNITFTVYQV